MKKLIWVLFLIGIISFVHASQGAIATTDFVTGLTILQADNATPVPDGWLCQIMIPGVDGLIDPPNSDGTPGGDDFLVTGVPGNNYYEFPFDTSWTGIPGQFYTPIAFFWPSAGLGTEPCANEGENFYLRLFDDPTVSGASNYLNSALYLLPVGNGNLFFNTTAHWDYTTGFNWLGFGGPAPIDWGAGMTGSVDVGTPSAPGSGYGTGLPNEDDLANPANVGLYFTLTIDDGAPVDVTICLDLTTLGYNPFNLAYYVNSAWVYYPDPYVPMTWTADCVTFTLDPTVTRGGRTDVDIPIVFSNIDGPLPVTLTNFAAEFVANNLTILWTTQSENSNMGWNIYRGESNSALENDETTKINAALIDGAGTTSEPTDYTFQDEYPVVELNTYWYWLESVSYSNDTEIYTPISLTIPEGAIIPVLPTTTLLKGNYPNPFNPSTFIQFDIKEGETGVLTIFNIKGQIIESMRFNAGEHDKEWDAKSVVSGVYFYKLTSESYTCTKKMLLLK